MFPQTAQEESRSISENVTWGQRERFSDGKVSMPYGRFLGFEKGEDGLPKIVEKEAAIVRKIYKLFLEGKTPSGITKHLTRENIEAFIRTLENSEGLITEFDEDLWIATVESVTVHTGDDITFAFKDGTELDWKI